jgi:hypothetical protein
MRLRLDIVVLADLHVKKIISTSGIRLGATDRFVFGAPLPTLCRSLALMHASTPGWLIFIRICRLREHFACAGKSSEQFLSRPLNDVQHKGLVESI